MKTLEDLGKYYKEMLLPALEIFEERRKKVLKRIIILFIIIFSLYLLILFLILYFKLDKDIIGFFSFGSVAVLIMGYKFITRKYVGKFKTIIIKNLVGFIDENLEYYKDRHISQADFVNSRIFRRHPDRTRGDDYVRGKIGKTEIEFSELLAEYKTKNSKGNEHWHPIFKGLFFIGDFNKHFKGMTVILPDTAERLFGQLGSFFQSLNAGRGQLIKLEDPEFEKMFVVYSDDQIESRYILSTSLMKRIVDFKKKTKRQFYISFVDSKIFIAISFLKNLFEPRVFKTVIDFGQIVDYYRDLELALSLIEELNLNRRIWSKQ